jgi:hypothetical protein
MPGPASDADTLIWTSAEPSHDNTQEGFSLTREFRNKYHLQLFGPFPAASVRFDYNSRDRLELETSLFKMQQEIINRFRQSGKTVEIQPLYRFRSFAETPGGPVFRLGHTDFGQYLLLDISRPEGIATGLPVANPLSVSAVTETSDHHLLMAARSVSVISAEGMIQSVPGGYIHPPDLIAETVRHELQEELAIIPEEITSISVMGLARIRPAGKPEILIHVLLKIPSSEILARQGSDTWEFSRMFAIPASRESVQTFLSSSGSTMAPASHAALSAFLYHGFGIRPDAS